MARINPLRWSIIGRDQSARAFDGVKKSLNTTGQAFRRIKDRAKAAASAMREVSLSMQGIQLPFRTIGRYLGDFNNQAQAIAQVEAGLRSTGGVAARTSQQLQKMASALQGKTLFGDENILRNSTAVLLTFTKITGETFDRAQIAVLDLATRLKTDLKSAATLVGKALNDPVKGATALSRAGVQFTDAQRSLLRRLVDAGRIAKAQGLVLQELATQFGGSAVAAAQVGTGWLTQLSNSWGDLGEVVGGVLNESLRPFNGAIADMIATFSELDPRIQQIVVTATAMLAVFVPLLATLGLLALAIGAIGGVAATAVAGIGAVVAAVVIYRDEINAALQRAQEKAQLFADFFVGAFEWVSQRVQEITRQIRTFIDNTIGTLLYLYNLLPDDPFEVPLLPVDEVVRSYDAATEAIKKAGNQSQLSADKIRESFGQMATASGDSVQAVESGFRSLPETVDRQTGKAAAAGTKNIQQLADNLDRYAQTAAGNVEKGAIDMKQAFSGSLSELFKISEDGFGNFSDRIFKIMLRMSDRILDQALKPIEEGIGDMLNNLLGSNHLGGAGGLGGLLGGLFGGGGGGVPVPTAKPAMGFASGGSFIVRGGGGVDSAMVAFRATPGERVDVSTGPQAQAGAVPVVVNIHTPNPEAFRHSEQQVTAQIARAVSRGQRGL